ncbi:hypothetical protein [Larkinella soli]|uniref:hypothetical protein n=1 Tax=Larkinella soli TaxID=1770527 RepID=UPI000FFB4D74|nr:hypothetical protein [Larkinella soli]
METGRYWVYEVTEQEFPLGAGPLRRTYQFRERLEALPDGPSGQKNFRVLRYRRSLEGQPWQPDSAFILTRQEHLILRTERNVSYLMLVLYATEGIRWNGNAYNFLDSDDYEVRNLGRTFSVTNQSFPETVTVIQQNDSTRVSQDRRLQVYARNVGLIYQEIIRLQFCTSQPSCIGKGQIDYGIRQWVRIREYGIQ